MFIIVVTFLLQLFKAVIGSFCGESAVPFSLEVLPSGHPVLGCARPNCFGWDAFGKPASANDSNFYRVNKQPDGFFRKALASTAPKPLEEAEAAEYRPQIASCQSGFGNAPCSGASWVGGIGPMSPNERAVNGARRPLLLRCCKWNGLAHSEDRGIATVRPGQIVYGGEVLADEERGRQFAFDYVHDIHLLHHSTQQQDDEEGMQRHEQQQQQAQPYYSYEVTIHRMACLPRPEQLTLSVEAGVLKQFVHKMAAASASASSLPEEQQQKNDKKQQQISSSSSSISSKKPKQMEGENKKFIKQQQQNKNKQKELQQKQKQQQEEQLLEENKQQQQQKQQQKMHQGESRVIETSNWLVSPLNAEEPEMIQQQQQTAEAAIQGPFMEEEEVGGVNENDDILQQHQQEQNLPNWLGAQQQGVAVGRSLEQRKRILCDRNMTRFRRQGGGGGAECAFVELDAPPGSQVQIGEGEGTGYNGGDAAAGNFYDPGETYYYSYTPGGGGSMGFLCFSADTRVRLASGQLCRMDELKAGDWVFSANGSRLVLSEVERWMHRVPDQWSDFVRIQLADGRVLKLTGEHFIYRCRHNCQCSSSAEGGEREFVVSVTEAYAISRLSFAKDVRPGDCLFTETAVDFAGGGEQFHEYSTTTLRLQRVLSVDTVREQGIYAPMTSSGDILTEGVLASCFAVEPSPVLQRSVFSSSRILSALPVEEGGMKWILSKMPHILRETFSLVGSNRIDGLGMTTTTATSTTMELPAWLHFVVDQMLPVVVPK